MLDHELLINKEVIVVVLVTHRIIHVDIARISQVLILAVLSVPQREHIVAALNHEKWEIQVR